MSVARRMPVRVATALAAVAMLVLPVSLAAHAGRPPEPHDVWTMWRPPLGLLAALALLGAAYARGLRALRRRAGPHRVVSPFRARCFAGGLAAIALAVATPLDLVSAALFSAHMVQHLLLVLIAGPLLALGRAELVLLWALPPRGRRLLARVWRRAAWLRAAAGWMVLPAAAWLLHTFTLWAWHMPELYDAAARSDAVHALEHATFVVTAVLFARPLVVRGARAAATLAPGGALLYLFAAAMQSGVLGALLALAGAPWYASHLATTGPWGLTPIEDQQIAGTLMWGPAGGAYLAAMLWEMRRWLGDAELASRPRAALAIPRERT